MKIERLNRFIANVEKLGYDPDLAIQRLTQVDDMEAETKRAIDARDHAVQDQVREQEESTRLHGETMNAEATLGDVNHQITIAQQRLDTVQGQVREKWHIIAFADGVRLLFSDISKIPGQLLLELGAMIQLAFNAGLKLGPLPFDFDDVRQKAIDVLEYAMGKSLVRREVFDEMLHSTVEKHDDLMLDRLGKMERERTKLTEEKAELAKFKETIDQATSEKLLTVALNMERKGFIQIHRCRSCGHPFAATPAGTKCTIHNCPFCGIGTASPQ